jgi:hypothetical protein
LAALRVSIDIMAGQGKGCISSRSEFRCGDHHDLF